MATMVLRDLGRTLKEFNGKKIVKVDGQLTKKFREAINLDKLPTNLITMFDGQQVEAKPNAFRVATEYKSLYLKARVYATFDGDNITYEQLDLYIGKINENNELIYEEEFLLNAIKSAEELIAYSVDEVKATRAKMIALAKEIEALADTLPYCARKVSTFSTP
jgi:hypothetical protein